MIFSRRHQPTGSTDKETLCSIQRILGKLGFSPGVSDGRFGPITERAVMDFEESDGLYVDAIVGPETIRALEEALARHTIEVNSPGSDAIGGGDELLPFERLRADTFSPSYASVDPGEDSRVGLEYFFLRADTAKVFKQVREELEAAGVRFHVSAGRRALSAGANVNRRACSFHYVGRAFDLHPKSGMQDPETDPYVITFVPDADPTEGGQRSRLAVYARAEGGVEPAELEAIYFGYEQDDDTDPLNRRVQMQRKTVHGRFVNLTELLARHEFMSIPARPPFLRRANRLAAEWWHFQYEGDLMKGVTMFEKELRRCYSEDTLRRSPVWAYRNRVFGLNWT